MKVEYDMKSYILYLKKISESKPVDSEIVNDDVILDEKGNVVGIEIWRARELNLPISQ